MLLYLLPVLRLQRILKVKSQAKKVLRADFFIFLQIGNLISRFVVLVYFSFYVLRTFFDNDRVQTETPLLRHSS